MTTTGAPSATIADNPATSAEAPTTGLLRAAAKQVASASAEDEEVAGYRPTDEQRAVLREATRDGLRCLVLPAGAGAGKTSTLKMLEETLPGRGQYTAFNRSLVNESKAKFRKARCSTTHSLAFGTVGKAFAHRLNGPRVRSEQVASMLGISDLEVTVGADPDGQPTLRKLTAAWLAGQVMVAVRRFCQSADKRISREHIKHVDGIDPPDSRANSEIVKSYLLPFAEKAWTDLSSTTGRLPFSHDVYVKLWQLGEGPNKPMIPSDYILLDEAQDTAPVFLDVLRQQTHAFLIFVGDSNQAIYEWRGAVDAMKAFPDAPRRILSQSFRFGQRIADVANSILAGLEEPTDLILKGLKAIPSCVFQREQLPNPKCVLTRTNAAAVAAVMDAQNRGKRTHLIASVDEVLSFVRAARDLQRGKPTAHPDLGCFNRWSDVVEYSKTDEGQELRLWVKLIDELGVERIISALENQVPEESADLVVCTAHKSKGREWTSVKLAGDFPPASKMSDSDRRLLYVAATRAKRVLDISDCPPFHPFRDRETGEETEGISIAFTGEMPTLNEALGGIGEEKKEPSVEQPKSVANVDGSTNGRAKSQEFSWTNYNGKWHVSGPPGHVDETVRVRRKNGSTSTERLGKLVKEFAERCIYDVGR
jgi:hypothetical protein